MKHRAFSSQFFIFIVLVLTWPIFGAWFTVFFRSWIWLSIAFLYGFFVVPEFYRSRGLIWLLIYALIIYFNYSSGDSYYNDIIGVLSELLILIVSCICAYFFLYSKDNKGQIRLVAISLFFVAFVSIASLIIDRMVLPNIIRENQHSFNSGIRSALSMWERFGLSNYHIPHAIPILIPALVLQIKQNNTRLITKLLFIVLLVLCIILTYLSGATTPFLYALIITILSWLITPGGYRSNITKLVVMGILLIFFFNDSLLKLILNGLDSIVGESLPIHERLEAIENSVYYSSAEGDVGLRADAYTISLSAFFDNILFGKDTMMGGHSAFLDRLGSLGLIGFIPYLAFILYFLKMIIRKLAYEHRIYYIVSIMAAFAILASKNMSNWPLWCFLMVITPLTINQASIGYYSNK